MPITTTQARELLASELRVGDIIIDRFGDATFTDHIIKLTTETERGAIAWVRCTADRIGIYADGTIVRNRVAVLAAMGPDLKVMVAR